MRGWAVSRSATTGWRHCGELYAYGSRLHRESNRLGVGLAAIAKAGPYLSITVTEAAHAGLALASALIDGKQFEKAEAVLTDSALLDSWENHQWQQYVRAYLMFATQRWPDVIAEAARILPAQAIIMSAVTAATNALAAHAAAHLGQGRVALDWAERVELSSDRSSLTEGRRHSFPDAAVTVIDPAQFPSSRPTSHTSEGWPTGSSAKNRAHRSGCPGRRSTVR